MIRIGPIEFNRYFGNNYHEERVLRQVTCTGDFAILNPPLESMAIPVPHGRSTVLARVPSLAESSSRPPVVGGM